MRRRWLLALVLLASCSRSARLSELQLDTAAVWSEGTLGVALSWAPGASCPALASETRGVADGVALSPTFLGGKHWVSSDDGLPYRRCVREARFVAPAAGPDPAVSRVELSDGQSSVLLEVEGLRSTPSCDLAPAGKRVLARGETVTVTCSPEAFRVREANVRYGARADPPWESIRPNGANGFTFVVPQRWSGSGKLVMDVDFFLPVRRCDGVQKCQAQRRLRGQSFDVEIR